MSSMMARIRTAACPVAVLALWPVPPAEALERRVVNPDHVKHHGIESTPISNQPGSIPTRFIPIELTDSRGGFCAPSSDAATKRRTYPRILAVTSLMGRFRFHEPLRVWVVAAALRARTASVYDLYSAFQSRPRELRYCSLRVL